MDRKLATIQKIDTILSIKDADKIECAHIMGWQVVNKKNEFAPQDLCIYCEIDSVMPEKLEFEFLRNKKFRVKTIKMRGQISQGLVLPLAMLGERMAIGMKRDYNNGKTSMVGMDVTTLLGITKYEIPVAPQLKGKIKGSFPAFIPKTDEMRLQSIIRVLDEINDKHCYITEKEDGTSYTAFHACVPTEIGEKEFVGVCSRNLELDSDDSVYWKITKQYDIENKLTNFYKETGQNLAIQGEITGDGINKNPLGLNRNSHQLHLFSIYNINDHKYLNYAEFIAVANSLNLPTVVTIYLGKFNFTLDQLSEMAKGKYFGTQNNREGIVIRPTEEYHSFILQGRLSFKVINNDYLLKEEL